MTIKVFTSLEQSKKMAEILPLESADMYYQYVLPKSDKIKHVPEIGNPEKALEWYNKGYTHFGKEPLSLKEYCIPCWSLASLLEQFEDAAGLAKDYGLWFAYDNGKSHCTKHFDNPVDAAFEMIVWLKENNKIK